MELADIRKDYRLKVMDENQISRDPLKQFENWLSEAIEAKVNEPTAMVLATATPDGVPSSRVVLLKALSDDGFGFFTNYSSRKGEEIALNQKVALLFHWPELERQVRIEGAATKTSAKVSDEYFHSRPLESRLSAVISNQSQVVPDREYLEKLWEGQQYKSVENMIERPSYWGGYRIEPFRIEFWQGRSNRLHDRILFLRKGADWVISRLAP
ncbi:MAG TPA: pyridoxamine 5'-phosphate oxidase [Prolixibacteraceae bacterium]|nr:pyridoxamine 5'-phosphate oxidase [Prolixibacteraceae bacterium]